VCVRVCECAHRCQALLLAERYCYMTVYMCVGVCVCVCICVRERDRECVCMCV